MSTRYFNIGPKIPVPSPNMFLRCDANGNMMWGNPVVVAQKYIEVPTFADLPDVVANAGEIYIVGQTTGIWPFRKLAGFYQSDGTAWKYLGSGDWVDLSSNQTIGGIKVFSSPVQIPDAIQSNEALSKGQFDSHVSRTDNPHGVTVAQIGAETPSGAQAKADAAKTYADAQDTATLSAAKSYTDTRETNIRSDFATADATTLSSAKSYTDSKNFDASHITSGVIDIARIPAAAIERMTSVSNQTARFALTTNDVQNGDCVLQLDTSVMYWVIDNTQLNSEAGYHQYNAGTAASVPWSGVTGKPTTIAGYGISDGVTQTALTNALAGYALTNGNKAITITGTGYGQSTSAQINLTNTTAGKTWGINATDAGDFQVYNKNTGLSRLFFNDTVGFMNVASFGFGGVTSPQASLHSAGSTILGVYNSVPDAGIGNDQCAIGVSEVEGKLYFRVRLENGNLKTGSITLA